MELEFNHIDKSEKGNKAIYYMKKLIRDTEIYKQYKNSKFGNNKKKEKSIIRRFRNKDNEE